MQEFLNVALSFPTVVWTALLLVALGYWLFVILGALDLELLDFDADIDLDPDIDLDVDVDAGVDVDVDPAIDTDAGIDLDVPELGLVLKLAVALGVGRVPVTILLTFLVGAAWGISYFSVLLLGSAIGGGALFGTLVLAGSFVLGLPIMGALAHPLKGVFHTKTKTAGRKLVGQVCDVTTGKVTADFGQARLEDGGAGLLLSVRCDEPNGLRRKSRALIIGFDEETNVYWVEPYDQMLVDDGEETVFDEAMQPASAQVEQEVAG
jgi:hypothetical protein